MCEKQRRIEELEIENANLYRTLSEAYMLNAEERKLKAEQRNIDSQIVWRPWQIVLIPTFISILALIAAIAK